jgi:glycosyltransferase involved in cell wall biosynthesis
MKILQIYEMNPLESIGGIEVAIYQLSKHLVKLGHEVTLLSGAGSRNGVNRRDGVRFINHDLFGVMKHSYSSGRLTLLRQFLFLSTFLAKRPALDFDVYHGHVYTSGLLANYLARRNDGIAVNTVHGSYYPVWDKLTNPLSATFYRNSERRLVKTLARHSDVQIHVSTYFADQVSLWGGDPRVIPNGVDPEVFHPGVEPRLDGAVPIILSARRLVRKNGIEYLIKAMRGLEDVCRLVVIGGGPERSRLESLAEDMGNVEFLGSVSHDKMPAYIASADIAVVPSIIEASSLFMLEAMAMGKPVIATSVGGLPEVLGDSGVLVPPMDSEGLTRWIRELLGDVVFQKRLGESARNRVIKNYTWEKIAKRVEAEYLRLWSEKNVEA